jgi:hypothetical protein
LACSSPSGRIPGSGERTARARGDNRRLQPAWP